jgi:hypothetical protein
MYGSQQTQYQVQQPIQIPVSSPRKSNTPIIIVSVVIAVIIVSLLLLLVVLPSMLDPYPIKEGDYLEYSYTGTVLFLSYSGTEKMEFTDITSTTYSVTITITGDMYQAPTTKTFPKEDTIGETDLYDLGTFISIENVDTAYGYKMLKHYHQYETGYDMDYWIGQETGAPYKMVIDYGSLYGNIILDLTDTNINWVKNGNA